jgi:uncharacterized membrane protein
MSHRHERILDQISFGLVLGAAVITASVWSRLPDPFPIHFDLHGRADGFAPKAVGAPLLLATTIFVWALLRFGGRMLTGEWRARFEASPTAAARTLTVAFFAILQILLLNAALGPQIALGRAFGIAFGVYWMIVAQIFPRLRRNPYVGIRTASTLGSDENWARTHRLGGIVCTVGGLVAVIAAILGAPAVSILAIVTSAAVPILYSLVIAART